jgi:hypothetical protein
MIDCFGLKSSLWGLPFQKCSRLVNGLALSKVRLRSSQELLGLRDSHFEPIDNISIVLQLWISSLQLAPKLTISLALDVICINQLMILNEKVEMRGIWRDAIKKSLTQI